MQTWMQNEDSCFVLGSATADALYFSSFLVVHWFIKLSWDLDCLNSGSEKLHVQQSELCFLLSRLLKVS